MKPCLMKDFLETKVPKTNEEYKIYLKKRDKALWWLMALGILLAALGFLGGYVLDVPIDDYMLGIYAGAGTGLVIAGILISIKHKLLMKNEEKLKKVRLEQSDERIQEISKRAMRMAAFVMIVVMYLLAFIGGLFYPILPKILLIMVCVFLVAYVIFYRIYEKNM